MKINIHIELDGSERDVHVLNAITRAIRDTPPEGYTSVSAGVMPMPPTEVEVHTTSAKATEAVESVVVAPGAQATITAPVPEGVDTKAVGQRLRELLLGVSKLEGKTIQDAKEIAASAAGVASNQIGKDFPSHPKANLAIAALEVAIHG